MPAKLNAYWRLMRLDRPIGILLLLWPTAWALLLSSGGTPDWHVALVFLLGVVLMRSAGCVVNDFADRKIDPHVKRTALRPIAAGEVSPREALILFTLLCLLAFGLVLTMNTLTIWLSVVAVFLAFTYPFMKRYTHLPQVYLGAAFGWSVPMTYAAHTNAMPGVDAWLLLITVVLWAVAYDTMYAMVDRDDDLKIGVKSTAILFGDLDRHIIGAVQLAMLLVLIIIGGQLALSWPYYAGLCVATALGIYQQRLIVERDRDGCFKAFLNNNWTGIAIFAGILGHYLSGTI